MPSRQENFEGHKTNEVRTRISDCRRRLRHHRAAKNGWHQEYQAAQEVIQEVSHDSSQQMFDNSQMNNSESALPAAPATVHLSEDSPAHEAEQQPQRARIYAEAETQEEAVRA